MEHRPPPYVIALCHQKGGVAKTTTALALGASLVEHQCETLLIDLDPQGNLSAGLGVNVLEMRHSAADVLLGNETLLRVSRESNLPGLDLVPANPALLTVAQHLPLRTGYEYVLRDAIAQPGMAPYEVVILDCPPTLGPLSLTALTAARLVVIPTQCEFFSLQGFTGLFKLIQLVRAKTNPDLIYRVLVTMFDKRGKLHGQMLTHLQNRFGDALLKTQIGFDGKLRESQVVGQPITRYAPASRGADHYRQLAEELLTYAQRPVYTPA